VVVHILYYPSSVLFETEEEACGYYNSIKDADHEDLPFITVCKILDSRGDYSQYDSEIEWYLEREV
jgi:hypothetical protein